MTDLEERLRRDAAAWRRDDSPPDFDVALDTAIGTRRGRPRMLWLTAAAAVVLAGAVVAAVLAWPTLSGAPAGGGHPRRYADYLSPQPDDLQWQHVGNIGFDFAVRGTIRADEVAVYVAGNTGAECAVRNSKVASVTRRDGSVTIVVSGEELLPKPDQNGTIAFACTGPPPSHALSARVHGPLGDLPVYNGLDKQPVAVLDYDELPTPTYLPPGYRQASVQRIDPADDKLTGESDYQNGRQRLLIVVGAQDQMPGAGQPVTGHVDIGDTHLGTPIATITRQSGTCLTWAIRPSVDTAVCSVGDTSLSVDTMARVARSLH